MTKTNNLSFYFDQTSDLGILRMVVEDNDCQLSRTYYGTSKELTHIENKWKSGEIWF